MILIQSTGALEECLQLPLLSSAFVASVHRDNPSHMAHATIAVLNLGPEGLSWIESSLQDILGSSNIHFCGNEPIQRVDSNSNVILTL